MNMVPEISVILPVYKAEQYLPQCIESLLMQAFVDFELLLIDDGSPDRCGEICDRYALGDKRVRVFYQQNKGVSAARNLGLQYAEGRYIAFVDSDDWVSPDYLLHLYEALPSEGVGLVMGGALKCGADSSIIGKIQLPDKLLEGNPVEGFAEYGLDRFGFSCSKLYNAELIHKNNLSFDCNVHCMEDLIFMIDYILLSDYIRLCNFMDYNYRIAYSAETLSSRMNTYSDEYNIFSAYRSRMERFEDVCCLSDELTRYLRHSVSLVFQRVLLSLHTNGYPFRQRVACLDDLLSREKEWIEERFMPDYKADCIAKYLLCHMGGGFFDCWISLLRFLRFKKSFGMH